MGDKRWYSVRVISGKEKNIEDNILRAADEAGIGDLIDEIFMPYEKIVKIKNNKKTIKERMFFPGYILILMEMTNKSKYVVENTIGVMRFVGPKVGNPIPLRNDEIKRIFGEVERKEGQELVDVTYKVGDVVKVISGPFIDFSGEIEDINYEKQKVKVKVSIFGRPTPIELDFFQIDSEG